jgi:hypothetical protein
LAALTGGFGYGDDQSAAALGASSFSAGVLYGGFYQFAAGAAKQDNGRFGADKKPTPEEQDESIVYCPQDTAQAAPKRALRHIL